LWVNCVDDVCDDRLISQEVLTKTLAGLVSHLLRRFAVFHIGASAHLAFPIFIGFVEFFLA